MVGLAAALAPNDMPRFDLHETFLITSRLTSQVGLRMLYEEVTVVLPFSLFSCTSRQDCEGKSVENGQRLLEISTSVGMMISVAANLL